METEHDLIRRRVLSGVLDTPRVVPEEGWGVWERLEKAAETIRQHAKPRILMGWFRYRGQRSRPYLVFLREKLELYEATGNKEALVDAFNYILLEWDNPFHPRAHFASTERSD